MNTANTSPAAKATPQEAALLIIDSMNEYAIDEKIAIRRELDILLRIDSLTLLLQKRDELDSMRANAQLSTLDAMQRINGAIRPQK